MRTRQRKKRSWRPWYALPVPPICIYCEIPCIVQHTSTNEKGQRIQHRYCPRCGTPSKTIYEP